MGTVLQSSSYTHAQEGQGQEAAGPPGRQDCRSGYAPWRSGMTQGPGKSGGGMIQERRVQRGAKGPPSPSWPTSVPLRLDVGSIQCPLHMQ